MKTPCEIVIWYIIPAIHRELARNLVKDIGLSQHRTAEILEATDAAISQYLSGKRAKYRLDDPEVLEALATLAQRLASGSKLHTMDLCELCHMVRARLPVDVEQPCPMDGAVEGETTRVAAQANPKKQSWLEYDHESESITHSE